MRGLSSKPLILINDSVRSLGIYVMACLCRGVIAEESRPDVVSDLVRVAEGVRESIRPSYLRNHPIIKAFRKVVIRAGVDPGRFKPLSELLVKRILRGDPIPHVNSIIDSRSMVAAETLIPLSVFDYDLVKTPLIMRRAIKGERFIDEKGRLRALSGAEIVVTDSYDHVIHVFPCCDGLEGAIRTGRTRRVLVIAYGAPEVPKALVKEAVERIRRYLTRYYPGAVCSSVRQYG